MKPVLLMLCIVAAVALATDCHPTPQPATVTAAKVAAGIDLAGCIVHAVPSIGAALHAPDWESKLTQLVTGGALQDVLCAISDAAQLAEAAPAPVPTPTPPAVAPSPPTGPGPGSGPGPTAPPVDTQPQGMVLILARAKSCEAKPAAECTPAERAALYLVRRSRYVGDVQIR